jgi:hypothetical protein
MSNLIYIHIGDTLPEYIFDSVYQSIIVTPNTTIYILVSDILIKECKINIDKLNTSLQKIQIIPLSLLFFQGINEYKNLIKEKVSIKFRDEFWLNTTLRFIIIY